jgi:hypothetical protein
MNRKQRRAAMKGLKNVGLDTLARNLHQPRKPSDSTIKHGFYTGVASSVRIYKVTEAGTIEDCNHSRMLELLEESMDFNKQQFLNHFPQPLKPGYYFANHSNCTGNYVAGTFADLIAALKIRGLAE